MIGALYSNGGYIVVVQRPALTFAMDEILNFRMARAAYHRIEQASQFRILFQHSRIPSRDRVRQEKEYIPFRRLSRPGYQMGEGVGLEGALRRNEHGTAMRADPGHIGNRSTQHAAGRQPEKA